MLFPRKFHNRSKILFEHLTLCWRRLQVYNTLCYTQFACASTLPFTEFCMVMINHKTNVYRLYLGGPANQGGGAGWSSAGSEPWGKNPTLEEKPVSEPWGKTWIRTLRKTWIRPLRKNLGSEPWGKAWIQHFEEKPRSDPWGKTWIQPFRNDHVPTL